MTALNERVHVMSTYESSPTPWDEVRVISHAHEEFDDQACVVVNMVTLELIELDEVGRSMWTALRETSSVDKTVSRLLEEFDAEAEQLQSDVRRFVEDLRSLGLVEGGIQPVPTSAPASRDLRARYLDLTERALLGLLYKAPENGPQGPDVDSLLAGYAVNHGLRSMPGFTMIGFPRLRNVRALAEYVMNEQIPGDFVETGVWRGGATIMMKAVLEAHEDPQRRVWVCDSFEGLPVPDIERYPDDAFWAKSAGKIAVSLDDVRENFAAFGLLDDRVEFLQGWFSDTMPTAPIHQIALLRLDGDLHQSTTEVLESLYAKVTPGGFVIIDDYCIDTCRAAVEEFRAKHHITAELQVIDWSAVFWQVPVI